MEKQQLHILLNALLSESRECEWIEFKHNNSDAQQIGEYISCLSNSACLHEIDYGYIVWGIEDNTLNIIGTTFRPKVEKRNQQEILNWLSVLLDPKIYFEIFEFDYNGNQIVIFRIPKASYIPVKFSGQEYVRVGSYKKKLKDHPEIERRLWDLLKQFDWSAMICEEATLDDLDPLALKRAKNNYKTKFPDKIQLIDKEWDDITFLNKAKITIRGKITKTALILLGKEDSTHFLNPSQAQITWNLMDKDSLNIAYEHFHPPFILNTEKIFGKIRNEIYRYIPNETLFPKEVKKYEPYVIREALHNCIAHTDYTLNGRITIVEKPDELIFSNPGAFLPGSIENVIESDSPPLKYHNHFLTNAMVNLNMIDTIGNGIKRIYTEQRNRFFPMPTYDLSLNDKVVVTIYGKVIDINYSRILNRFPDLNLHTVILLDKVQKGFSLSDPEAKILRKKDLIEGRKPKFKVVVDMDKAESKILDNEYFKNKIVDLLTKKGQSTREDLDDYLDKILPSKLSPTQKKNKVNNLLNELSNKESKIENIGSKTKPIWIKVL